MKNPSYELTPEQRAELEALAAMPDDEIDTSDIPEVINWSRGVRGLFHMSPDERRKAIEELKRNHPANADTSERGLESYITALLTGMYGAPPPDYYAKTLRERPAAYGTGWIPGEQTEYDREHCVDLIQLFAFLKTTQPEIAESLSLNTNNPTRRQFLARLKAEVGRRGVIDALRNGVRHRQHDITLFYASPSPGNDRAERLYRQNRFSVTRQLRYSSRQKNLALDLALFVNGLPVATFELKNSLTKQTVDDAVRQYKLDRDPREDLFKTGRCMVHFALDESEVRFCTKLDGNKSVFLPFNKGRPDGGAGNPLNPNGLKTDYLWREVLTPASMTDIIENYAKLIETKDANTGRIAKTQVWPRYHQLDVTRKLLDDVQANGAGQRYLIQHSAGSGKSNSIAWLAHRLVGLQKDDAPVFNSIIVVTDRVLLDDQTHSTIQQFAQIRANVGHADRAADLRMFIEGGKKIIISTIQKFPHILNAVQGAGAGRKYAIIIDEAHSSQGGRLAGDMAATLGSGSESSDDTVDTFEDKINAIIQSRRLLENASYFAFTATPKNKTLELFGQSDTQPDGKVRHLPFHSYTMKQAIQEGFILDVLSSYTSVASYYNLVKKIEDDPEFDSRRAQRKLRRYVEGHEHAIRLKAEIIADHFHDSVYMPAKIGKKARAMVVVDGVGRALDYFHALQRYLKERNRPYQAIVAFSGEREYGGETVSETSLNGFPSRRIAEKIQEEPYRILVCADKFQTGYDEPLLQTMYVDKTLSGVKAVQTLSRLNRAYPDKSDVFVLDFMNDTETIERAFVDYYQTTILAEETEPNRLHDLKAALDGRQVYSDEQRDEFVRRFLDGVQRDKLDPILDSCVETYLTTLDEDGQVDFKGSAKGFVRSYAFLSQVLPYAIVDWEKLSIFLNFLIPKLPAPIEDDLSRGILEAIDMDSYRAEKQETQKIILADEDAEIDPVPVVGGGHIVEPDLNPLSVILSEFNSLWGTEFTDTDRVGELIAAIPERVEKDEAYRNARLNSGQQNARIEHDAALDKVIIEMLRCNTELYKTFTENADFRRWLENKSFDATYES